MKISRLEQEVETLKDESLFYERKATEKNNALRQINNIITEYEKNGPIHSTIYNQIKEIVQENVEKKLSDEILTHYTSNS
jgi:hypothetical protein